MKILEFFNKKRDEEIFDGNIDLFFTIDDANSVHSNDISKEVHTMRKYYYKMPVYPITDINTSYDTSKISYEDIYMYLPVTFAGTKAIGVEEYLKSKLSEVPGFPIKRTSINGGKVVVVQLDHLMDWVTDIHIEKCHVECEPCGHSKYILHCFDTKTNVDLYFVFHNNSLDSTLRKYLIHPDWVK